MVRFFTQPDAEERLGDILRVSLEGTEWQAFQAAVAFLKRSGIRHISTQLRSFSEARPVKVVVGIDHQGTTQEGLEILLASLGACGAAYVLHNRGVNTFHPKVYAFSTPPFMRCIVGSGNATDGGFFKNFEAFFDVTVSREDEEGAALIGSVQEAFSRWMDVSTPIVQRLSADLIQRLRDSGLILPEAASFPVVRSAPGTTAGTDARDRSAGFGSIAVPPSPSVAEGGERQRVQRRSRATEEPAPAVTEGVRGFVITLQKTDVGVGQTTSGTSRRSPELFIPKICVRDEPEFWGWPDKFVPDPEKPTPTDNEGFSKMDRNGVRMILGGSPIDANWWYNPNKRDYRIRSEALRSAGEIGDILRIEAAPPDSHFDYYVEVIPQGTADFARYEALCTRPVRNSLKRYGYYSVEE